MTSRHGRDTDHIIFTEFLTCVKDESLFARLDIVDIREIELETWGMGDDDLDVVILGPIQSKLAGVWKTTVVYDAAFLIG